MATGGRISTKESRELQAVVVAIKALDADTRKEIRTRTRAMARQEWTEALARRATSEQQRRLIVKTARVNVTDQGVQVTAATQKRGGLSGGATPYDEGKSFEFGNSKKKYLPPSRRQGYVFWPAAADMVPRLLALWAQTAVRTAMEALEGKKP
jgi:hypothetical protein